MSVDGALTLAGNDVLGALDRDRSLRLAGDGEAQWRAVQCLLELLVRPAAAQDDHEAEPVAVAGQRGDTDRLVVEVEEVGGARGDRSLLFDAFGAPFAAL
ncbi:MAG: hypothetical protein H0W06_05245 [Chloroflexia bacterium]|nr:hypothetical protein [Chloroflexia bacterium]